MVARSNHIARAYPPSVTKPLLARYDHATALFAARDLYGWKDDLFWGESHAQSVFSQLQLPLREGGAGFIATSEIADAAYVASFFEPAPAIADLCGVPLTLFYRAGR